MLQIFLLSQADLDKEVACLVIVFSLTDRRSLDNAKRILQNVTESGLNNLKGNAKKILKFALEEILRDNTPVILVGNKTDLVRARQITEDEAKAVAVSFCCKYVEVMLSG